MMIGKRIRELRHQKNLKQGQLAEMAGIARSYLCRVEAGQQRPSVKTLQKIAHALNITPGYLLQPEVYIPVSRENIISYPILREIETRKPFEEENYMGHISIPEDLAPAGEVFALKVFGDSMAGEGIREGNYIFLRKQNIAENGDIIVALIDDRGHIGRYYKKAGQIVLQPANPHYEPIIITQRNNLRILGKIVMNIAKF